MADTQETIADIIREARDKYTVHNCNECNYRKSCDWNDWNFGSVECEAKRQSISLLLGIDDDYFNKLLTRFEAAHKREVQNALDTGGFVEASRENKQAGNAAKLREVVDAMMYEAFALCDSCVKPAAERGKLLAKWCNKLRAALAATEKEGGAK